MAQLAWPFVGLGLVTLVTGALSALLLYQFAQKTIATLRLALSHHILESPLSHVEALGIPRLMAALTDDVQVISQALLILPAIGLNCAIMLAGAAYLGWLSWSVFLPMLGSLVLGVLGYRVFAVSALRALRRVREEQDILYRHFRGLTDGFKELKLYRSRRLAFLLDHMRPTITSVQQHNVSASVRFVLADSWSLLLFFVLLGAFLFRLPTIEGMPSEVLTGYVLTTLYMMRPLGMVLRNMPILARGQVGLQKIESLGLSLVEPVPLAPLVPTSWSEPDDPTWTRLALSGVTYTYRREDEDRPFALGPLDLVLEPGELVFMVGGNGSGKTTLAKLLCGLYTPDAGEVRWNGQAVTDVNQESYRQLFAVVFADPFLFETLLGLTPERADRQAQDYLGQLQLDHKVTVEEGRLSTTALSQGQRKRLALLVAYLEDRPIYVFDEWAADQDPQFREMFYTQLVPDLQKRGKTVVVISHDARYYHLADRLLTLDEGRLIESVA